MSKESINNNSESLQEELPPETVKGKVSLCFFCLDAHWYAQGHIVTPSKIQYGIYGSETDDHPPIDCCLQNEQDNPMFFNLTIIDFIKKKDYTEQVVKTFGDYARFRSENIDYKSHTLLNSDHSEFVARLGTLFPKISQLSQLPEEIFIVFGDIEINFDGLKKAKKSQVKRLK